MSLASFATVLGLLGSAVYQPAINTPTPKHAEERQSPAPSSAIEQKLTKKNAERMAKSRARRIEIVREGTDHAFSVIVQIENLDTGEDIEFKTESDKELPILKPGHYEILTLASSQGFPQEAKYQVLDEEGVIVRAFERSHVPVTNVTIERGQRLRIVIPPAIRPYNAVFYEIAGVHVGHVIARPYPSNDFEPGAFNGSEQFNSFPLALAFLGERAVERDPARAERIREKGERTGEGDDVVKDPILVLGSREVGSRLAQTFVRDRKTKEGFRSADHVSLLIQRDQGGTLPSALAQMTQEQLERIFAQKILWMIHYNVHRHNEGGGYARKTFEEDMAEAREKLREWPLISYQSTELYRTQVRMLQETVAYQGKLASVPMENDDGTTTERLALDLLQEDVQRMVRAAYRERLNLLTYPTSDLRPLEEEIDQTATSRVSELERVIRSGLEQLSVIEPGAEKSVIPPLSEAKFGE
jgi:hypothetical protein